MTTADALFVLAAFLLVLWIGGWFADRYDRERRDARRRNRP